MSSRLMRKSVEGRSLLLALGLVCLFVFAAADVSDSAEEPLPDYSITAGDAFETIGAQQAADYDVRSASKLFGAAQGRQAAGDYSVVPTFAAAAPDTGRPARARAWNRYR